MLILSDVEPVAHFGSAFLGAGVGGAIAYLMLTKTIPLIVGTFRDALKEVLDAGKADRQELEKRLVAKIERIPCVLPTAKPTQPQDGSGDDMKAAKRTAV